MNTDFEVGDDVECEWSDQHRCPRWDNNHDMDNGNGTGEWKQGKVISIGGSIICTKLLWTDEFGENEIVWYWNATFLDEEHDGWLRKIGGKRIKATHNECTCDSFTLTWFGHSSDCKWKLNKKLAS